MGSLQGFILFSLVAFALGEPAGTALKVTKQNTGSVENFSIVEGRAVAKGQGVPVRDGLVIAQAQNEKERRVPLHEGKFSLALPAGIWRIEIKAPGFRPFIIHETIGENEKISLTCLVRALSIGVYEEVISAHRGLAEVSRTTLRGREIHRVPGTFSDPYKIVNAMPGVSQAMTLMPLPIVRGTGPSATGLLLDGVPLPLFYHALAGPSVIHPYFLESIAFFPGTPDIEYGGYVGGIMDGTTRVPFSDDPESVEFDLNLIQAGALLHHRFAPQHVEMVSAVRAGYPNGLLSALSSDARLSFWDYQTRIAVGDKALFFSAMVLGARDNLETLTENAANTKPTLFAEFHKLILKVQERSLDFRSTYRVALNYDLSAIESAEPSVKSYGVAPHVSWRWQVLPNLRFRAGLEGQIQQMALDESFLETANPENPTHQFLLSADAGLNYQGATWLGTRYGVPSSWTISPGVRVDFYANPNQAHWSVQPRLTSRVNLYRNGEESVWLKLGSGLYSQPARPYLALPGMSATALHLGLMQSWQNMVGAEWHFGGSWSVDGQVYYNQLDPAVYELQLNHEEDEFPQNSQTASRNNHDETQWLTALTQTTVGRCYGIELLIRKNDNGRVFGWLSYGIARSERLYHANYLPYDFDRTHILSVLSGIKLPRDWEISARFALQSGTPLSTVNQGKNAGRAQTNWRVDLRVDKRAVFDRWILDFYIEIQNATVNRETGGLLGADGFRYVLPTMGMKALF